MTYFVMHQLMSCTNTFVPSDILQGLGNAVASLLPYAEHRNCARHIYANWKKKGHSSEELRVLFWSAVKCTTREGFARVLDEMRELKAKAVEDFEQVGVMKFCRAFISDTPKCEAIDNNMSESFNSRILECRSKPIIDMLEWIRRTMMDRIVRNRELFSDRTDPLCPRIRTIVQENLRRSRKCIVFYAEYNSFEVCTNGEGFVADLGQGYCACRYWAITGIPCFHALACIQQIRADPATYVSSWLTSDIYRAAYSYGMRPMNGMNMWPEIEGCDIYPPLAKKQPGRPKHRRRADISEAGPSGQTLSKKGVQMRCSICSQVGHNKKTCAHRRIQAACQVWFEIFLTFFIAYESHLDE